MVHSNSLLIKGLSEPGGGFHCGVIHDRRLTAKAKGILAFLASLTEYSLISRELVQDGSADGPTSIKSGLDELEGFSYLVRESRKSTRKRSVFAFWFVTDAPAVSYQCVGSYKLSVNAAAQRLDERLRLSREDVIPAHAFGKKASLRGYIYAVQATKTGLVKIGFSEHLKERMKQLKSGHGEDVKIIWVAFGAFSAETNIHNRLSEYAVGGEWFDFQRKDPVVLLASHTRDLGIREVTR